MSFLTEPGDDDLPEISQATYDAIDLWAAVLDDTPKLDKRATFEAAAGELYKQAHHEKNLGAYRSIEQSIYVLGREHAGLADDDIDYVMISASATAEIEAPKINGRMNGHAADEPPPVKGPEDYLDDSSKPIPADKALTVRIIEPTPFKFRPATEIPKRAWLYGRHYLRGCVTATIAPPGWTKSTRSLTELIAMALVRPLLGETPTTGEPLRCWYWSGEDEREEVERRAAAICQHHKIDARELEGRLFFDSANEVPLKIASITRAGLVFDEKAILQITDAILRNKIDVAVFEPLVSLHNVPENDNVSIDQVVKKFGKIAADTNCAIDIDHHTRKLAPGQTEVVVEDARGAGPIIGAVRSSRIINRMSAQEAANVGLSEVERQFYFRIARGKANRAPPEAATWARMVSVPLPNGDNVGALEPWEYPDAFNNVTTADMTAIRELAGKKEFRADSRAQNWIGCAIADRLGLNVKNPPDAAKIKRIVKTWIKNDVLAVDEREDEHRKKRQYVIPGQWKDGAHHVIQSDDDE